MAVGGRTGPWFLEDLFKNTFTSPLRTGRWTDRLPLLHPSGHLESGGIQNPAAQQAVVVRPCDTTMESTFSSSIAEHSPGTIDRKWDARAAHQAARARLREGEGRRLGCRTTVGSSDPVRADVKGEGP